MKNKNVIISFGNRSVFSRILAAIFYSITLVLFYKCFISEGFFSEEVFRKNVRSNIYLLSMSVVLAIKFSVIENHHFNFKEMKYRKFYSVGPIGFGKWKKFKKLNRVSTFLNNRGECEVNIWDINNNKYKIAAFNEIDNAVIYGRDLAKNLKIKFKERK